MHTGEHDSPPSNLSTILKQLGINDPDWVAIILFVRNLLTKLTIYTDEKKAEIQREVFAELAQKDFSPQQLEAVIAMLDMYVMQTIGTLELEEALAQEKKSAAQLLNDMSDLLKSMSSVAEHQNKKMDILKEQTIGALQSGKDRSVIVAKVRKVFQELTLEFKKRAAELQARVKMLERKANFDPLLTELYNRRAFDAFLQSTVDSHSRDAGPLSLTMIDVDNFKKVNDNFGHQAGDDVLQALAHIITTHATQYRGFAARYGGEELVIITKNVPEEIAVVHAEAIRKDVERYDFRIRTDGQLAEHPLNFTVSIGIAIWQEGWDTNQLIQAADKALYQAKKNGRNQVVIAR